MIGGFTSQFGSNLSKEVTNQIGKAATRISVQASTGAATNATLQFIDKREIDPKQLLLNTVGQIAVASTAEVSQDVSHRVDTHTRKTSSKILTENLGEEKKFKAQMLKQKLENSFEHSSSSLTAA